MEAVVEVGEEEDFAVGEGVEEGGLVYAVEGAGFHLAYAVVVIKMNKVSYLKFECLKLNGERTRL